MFTRGRTRRASSTAPRARAAPCRSFPTICAIRCTISRIGSRTQRANAIGNAWVGSGRPAHAAHNGLILGLETVARLERRAARRDDDLVVSARKDEAGASVAQFARPTLTIAAAQPAVTRTVDDEDERIDRVRRGEIANLFAVGAEKLAARIAAHATPEIRHLTREPARASRGFMEMSNDEGTPAPATPISTLASLIPNAKPKPTQKPKTEKTEAKATEEKAIEAPFPIGTRLKYAGMRWLCAGYTAIPILEPGTICTVVDVGGAYSVVVLEVPGTKFELAIAASAKSEWVVLGS